MSSWARVQYDRRRVNEVLVRCKNGSHDKRKARAEKRDQRRLQEVV